MAKFGPSISLIIASIVIPHIHAEIPWNVKELSHAPKSYPAPGFQELGVHALFFDGLPWRGKPTRVFAWYGAPVSSNNAKVPAVILVHGGGGTAYADWVRLWNSRGYAAIAIDTCGSVPVPVSSQLSLGSRQPAFKRDEYGGPACWDQSFTQIEWPIKDQWTYHAVADILLAHSLLRSFPEVDQRRIGITGISWGGYLTAIAAGIDSRFRFAVPVYGCGFLGDDSHWQPTLAKLGTIKAKKWFELWDPSVYLNRAKMPMLWVDGTNDFFYPLDSLQKSYRLPRGPQTLSIHLRMNHSQPTGQAQAEIYAFADQRAKKEPPLATVLPITLSGGNAQIEYRSEVPILKAELLYTLDTGLWVNRRWQTASAEVVSAKGIVRASVPAGTQVLFFNLTDTRGLIVSSDYHSSDASK